MKLYGCLNVVTTGGICRRISWQRGQIIKRGFHRLIPSLFLLIIVSFVWIEYVVVEIYAHYHQAFGQQKLKSDPSKSVFQRQIFSIGLNPSVLAWLVSIKVEWITYSGQMPLDCSIRCANLNTISRTRFWLFAFQHWVSNADFHLSIVKHSHTLNIRP